jgi:phage repressor protein C with HTH and peptisase S24 domain
MSVESINNKSDIINSKVRGLIEDGMKKKFNNQVEFAKYLGVTQATVSRYLSGNTLPSLSTLKKMANVLGIDLGLINDNYISKEKQGIVKIPFYYSEVSAGRGLSSMDSSYDYMFLDENWFKNQFLLKNMENIFTLKVRGDSMEPIISEGDIVIAQVHTDTSNLQGVYIVSFNDDFLIKKVQFKSRYLVKLISNNPDYDPIEIDLQNPEVNFKIVAKVLGRINIKSFTNIEK